MALARLHVGQIGAEILCTFKDENGDAINLSTQTAMVLYLERPNGTVLAPLALAFKTDGLDGQARYLTLAGTLDVPGPWRGEGKVTLGSGEMFPTSIEEFYVDYNLY